LVVRPASLQVTTRLYLPVKLFAQQFGVNIVCISQIDRAYHYPEKKTPTLDDVRLPNPLDLALFDRACFLHEGRFEQADL